MKACPPPWLRHCCLICVELLGVLLMSRTRAVATRSFLTSLQTHHTTALESSRGNPPALYTSRCPHMCMARVHLCDTILWDGQPVPSFDRSSKIVREVCAR